MTVGQIITGGVALFTFVGMVIGAQAWLDSRHADAEEVKKGFYFLQDQIKEIRQDSLRRDRSRKQRTIREIEFRAEDRDRELTAKEKLEIKELRDEITELTEKLKGMDKK